MDTINRRYIWIFFTVLIVIMVAAYLINTMTPRSAKPYLLKTHSAEAPVGQYYTVKDNKGKIVFQTGLALHIDDQYISENDQAYVIVKVEGMNALAKSVPADDNDLVAQNLDDESWLTMADGSTAVAATPPKRHVVIYHTHSDESYTPTAGKASQPGEGGIFAVGSALRETLKNAGIKVTHSWHAHDPHDINAYHRSRRTAAQLLKEQPDAVFDIHRDSAPIRAYYTTINGIDSARVMMVVGRSNPHMKTNLAYARRIKAKADKLYPGLVRGIFLGRGSYNQDLYPTAMLFEIGTDKVSQDLAEKAARCLGDVLIRDLGVRK